MLRNTFCHIPGIGPKTEQRLWSSGVHSWDALLAADDIPIPRVSETFVADYLEESYRRLANSNPNYFSNLLPSHQLWRLFPDFRDSVAYMDIETTGLRSSEDTITTIALYDGKTIFYYIKDVNLDDFKDDIKKYRVIVTFNGRCFDVPFIERHFKIRLASAHIDLRYVLRSLGYRGGLKRCEKQLGMSRGELEGIDGYFAVLLWKDFVQNQNGKALDTLLAYNIQDTMNLETLLVLAYNMNLENTPFSTSHLLPLPPSRPNPFQADMATIERIRAR